MEVDTIAVPKFKKPLAVISNLFSTQYGDGPGSLIHMHGCNGWRQDGSKLVCTNITKERKILEKGEGIDRNPLINTICV
jgi:hypothetical protein